MERLDVHKYLSAVPANLSQLQLILLLLSHLLHGMSRLQLGMRAPTYLFHCLINHVPHNTDIVLLAKPNRTGNSLTLSRWIEKWFDNEHSIRGWKIEAVHRG